MLKSFPLGQMRGLGHNGEPVPCVEGDGAVILLKAACSIWGCLDCGGLGPGQGAESVFALLSCVITAKPVQSQVWAQGSESWLLQRPSSPPLRLPNHCPLAG